MNGAHAATAPDARSILDTVDWRRATFDIYRRVRAEPDPEKAHALWRGARDTMLSTHPASPIPEEARPAFLGVPMPPYDPRWRFRATIQTAQPIAFTAQTGTDGAVRFERVGVVRIDDIGSLDVWAHAGYAGGLFIPVKDASAGTANGTYGGGRYLLDTIKGADLGADGGALIIDFNFAYNPSCAYDPGWACPLPPLGNTVGVKIPVGEHFTGKDADA